MTKISGSNNPQNAPISSSQSPSESPAAQKTSEAKSSAASAAPSQNAALTKSTEQEARSRLNENKMGGQILQAELRSKMSSSTLERGSRGSEVETLQNALIKGGYMTQEQKATGPGVFGPQTEAALKAYQRDHGLKADGIFGPKTQGAIAQQLVGSERAKGKSVEQGASHKNVAEVKQESTPSSVPSGPKEIPDSQMNGTRTLEEQAKLYDKYEKLIPANKMKNGTNEMNIVGMRHHDIESSKDLRKYDDRFVVLWKDESGQKHVKVFEGATHTGQTSTKGNFTDVNKDGKADIAHIKPGTYDFHLGRNEKFGDHLRPDSKIDAWRDTNQDGRITGDEKNTDYTASAILFHKGGPTAPRSVGCQTLEPNEYEKFINLIKQDPNDKVSYTLVDASKS